MPIYEYQCRQCGKTTDVRHGFDETNSQTCPACGGELAKKFGAAGIVFKGSGFYVTDSRSAKSAAPSGDKRDSKSDAAKPETSSEAPKTETKAEPSTPATKGEGAAA